MPFWTVKFLQRSFLLWKNVNLLWVLVRYFTPFWAQINSRGLLLEWKNSSSEPFKALDRYYGSTQALYKVSRPTAVSIQYRLSHRFLNRFFQLLFYSQLYVHPSRFWILKNFKFRTAYDLGSVLGSVTSG